MKAVELALLPIGAVIRYQGGNTGRIVTAGATVVIKWDHIDRTSLLKPADTANEDIIADLSVETTATLEVDSE